MVLPHHQPQRLHGLQALRRQRLAQLHILGGGPLEGLQAEESTAGQQAGRCQVSSSGPGEGRREPGAWLWVQPID